MLTFQELYSAYVEDVYRFSLWITGDRFDAEDITSDTFIRAWVRRDRIRTETLKAYLFTIARNIYLQRQRKRKRQVALADTYPDKNSEPDDLVENRMELLKVNKILQAIPEVDRSAFIMRVQHELPYAELARALGISEAAARVKIHRVRKRLLIAFVEKEVKDI